jgi:hypothetical protein
MHNDFMQLTFSSTPSFQKAAWVSRRLLFFKRIFFSFIPKALLHAIATRPDPTCHLALYLLDRIGTSRAK